MAMTSTWALDNPIFFTPPPVFGRYGRLFKGNDAPAAPDPYKTADAQAKANVDAARQTAVISRTNEVSPFGTTSWTQDPNNQDKWTSTFKLDPNVQSMLDQFYAASKQPPAQKPQSEWLPAVQTGNDYRKMAEAQNNPESLTPRIAQSENVAMQAGTTASMGQANMQKLLQTAMPTADNAARKAVEDAYYAKAKARLDPQWQQTEAEMRSRLANQGLTEGSEAYNKELQQMMMGRNDAYSGATNEAIIHSTDEMKKIFDMALQGRQQTVNESGAAMGMYGTASGIANNNALTKSQLYDSAYARAGQMANTDSTLRGNKLNEDLTLRNMDTQDRNNILNQLMALRTGSQVNAPGTGMVPVAAAPIAQSIYNTYNGQLQAAGTSQAGWNSILGTAGTLGAAYMMGG